MIIAKIGHASTSKGAAANQVLIKENYSFSPTVVLRPKTAILAEKSALACEAGCNNNNILYSQGSRHTLNDKAKQTDYDLSSTAITTTCYADCSSFMTVCAKAGGASISGLPCTSDMVKTKPANNPFSKGGDYEILTDSLYLTSSDYLQRGDILVKSGHTLMVLVNGCKVPNVSNLGLKLDITSIHSNQIKAKLKVVQTEDDTVKVVSDQDVLDAYIWKYKVITLRENKTHDISKLKVSSSTTTFSVANLTHNSYYAIQVEATNKDTEEVVTSQNIVFVTTKVVPSTINSVNAKFNLNNATADNIVVSFSETYANLPSTFTKGYRFYFIVNGKVVLHRDDLIKSNSKIAIPVKDISRKQLFGLNDNIQVGIQSWIHDGNNYIFDNDFPICSEPYFVKIDSMNPVDKLYLKTSTGFNYNIIHLK